MNNEQPYNYIVHILDTLVFRKNLTLWTNRLASIEVLKIYVSKSQEKTAR